MREIQRILAATDFGADGNAAVEYACLCNTHQFRALNRGVAMTSSSQQPPLCNSNWRQIMTPDYESPLANKFVRLAGISRFRCPGFLCFLGFLGFIPGCERPLA